MDCPNTIMVYNGFVDMRKSIDGLCMLVSAFLTTGNICEKAFIFRNKRLDKIKIIFKEENGFCLFYKRLDKGTFKLKIDERGVFNLTKQELRWVLDGLDYTTLKPQKSPNYQVYF